MTYPTRKGQRRQSASTGIKTVSKYDHPLSAVNSRPTHENCQEMLVLRASHGCLQHHEELRAGKQRRQAGFNFARTSNDIYLLSGALICIQCPSKTGGRCPPPLTGPRPFSLPPRCHGKLGPAPPKKKKEDEGGSRPMLTFKLDQQQQGKV